MLPSRMVQRRLNALRRPASPAISKRSSRRGPVLAAVLLLAACADEEGGHVAATTLMGGALGIPAGPIGVVVGAGVGAIAGATAPKEVFEGGSRNDQR
jgi:phage tail tape-measure protein